MRGVAPSSMIDFYCMMCYQILVSISRILKILILQTGSIFGLFREALEKIRMLRERANKYREKLAKNEMLTRYALIDSFLRLLCWDTDDPSRLDRSSQHRPGAQTMHYYTVVQCR